MEEVGGMCARSTLPLPGTVVVAGKGDVIVVVCIGALLIVRGGGGWCIVQYPAV